MKPDRSDYEIWLIDWLDGKLDQSGTDQLMRFLDENPDLREEAELISQVKLEPGSNSYSFKQKLLKNPSELTDSHIEVLSVAALEKDITDDQQTELEENFRTFPDNKKIFDTIQQTRLIPDLKITFAGKKNLVKGVFYTGTTRLIPVWISAAAVITLLLTIYFFKPEKSVQNTNKIITASVSDTTVRLAEKSVAIANNIAENTLLNKEKNIPQSGKNQIEKEHIDLSTQTAFNEIKTVPEVKTEQEVIPARAEVLKPYLSENSYINTLIASADIPLYQKPVDDGRSRFEKFIAKNFREKLLKEEIPVDSPLKSYEIAEAGIDGLNKLLGWEMTLVKNSDEEGEIQSVSFNSRLLKFNAPVKNEEPPVTF